MLLDDSGAIERWINEDPSLRDYIHKAQDFYRGPIKFIRNGRKKFQARLDCDKLSGFCKNAKEAYFEINLSKKAGTGYKDFFYLKIITADKSINTIKLF